MSELTKVAQLSDLPPGEMTTVEVDGDTVLLVNVDGAIWAVSETCPHEEGPLSEGYLDENRVECPWHGSNFDVTDGKYIDGPASAGLKVYPTRVEGDAILIGPPEK